LFATCSHRCLDVFAPTLRYASRMAGRANNPPLPLIGSRLRELRELRLLTVRELASVAGVSYQTVSALENDRRPASVRTVRMLAKALGVELAVLTGRRGVPEGYGPEG
jgi:DNA-binding XRE family transcriptional regulator